MAPKLHRHEARPAGGEAPSIEPASSAERPGALRVSEQRAAGSSEPGDLAPDTGSAQEGDGEDPDDAAPVDGFVDVEGEIADDSRAVSRPALREPEHKTDSLARVDPFRAYMREVQQHPLLSSEEEHALAVRYAETGDVATAARLVTANLRLVVKLAYEYRRAYRNMMDLIQEGNIGLMQAVKRYDPYRGVKLSSYAAWWIRAYMLRFILNNWRLVKIGTTQAQRKLFFNLNKERARLAALGVEPSHAEIASRLNVDEKDVAEMDRRLSRGDASLDASVSDAEGRASTRMELLPSGSEGPDALTEGIELQEIVRAHLDEFRQTLQGKDVIIYDKRLVAEEPMTLQELGNEFGVSRERVRQLEARLTGRLREYLRTKLGDAVEVQA